MDDEDLFDRLERQGRAAPPSPSPALRERLTGARLTRPVPLRPRPLIGLGVALPSAAVAAVIIGFVIVTFGRPTTPDTVVVQEASNARVEGDPLRPGAHVRDGQVIVTGADGYFVAGAITIGPNSRAVVRDGDVILLRGVATATTPVATTTTTATAPPATTTTTTSVRLPTTTSTTATAPVSTPTTTTPAGGPSTRPEVPATIQLRAGRTPRGIVFFQWSRYDGTDFGAYVVRRLRDGSVAFRSLDQETLQGGDRSAPPPPARYVVVVVNAERQVVARSNLVEV